MRSVLEYLTTVSSFFKGWRFSVFANELFMWCWNSWSFHVVYSALSPLAVWSLSVPFFMGCTIKQEEDCLIAYVEKMIGTTFRLKFSSVCATQNLIMSSVFALSNWRILRRRLSSVAFISTWLSSVQHSIFTCLFPAVLCCDYMRQVWNWGSLQCAAFD